MKFDLRTSSLVKSRGYYNGAVSSLANELWQATQKHSFNTQRSHIEVNN